MQNLPPEEKPKQPLHPHKSGNDLKSVIQYEFYGPSPRNDRNDDNYKSFNSTGQSFRESVVSGVSGVSGVSRGLTSNRSNMNMQN